MSYGKGIRTHDSGQAAEGKIVLGHDLLFLEVRDLVRTLDLSQEARREVGNRGSNSVLAAYTSIICERARLCVSSTPHSKQSVTKPRSVPDQHQRLRQISATSCSRPRKEQTNKFGRSSINIVITSLWRFLKIVRRRAPATSRQRSSASSAAPWIESERDSWPRHPGGTGQRRPVFCGLAVVRRAHRSPSSGDDVRLNRILRSLQRGPELIASMTLNSSSEPPRAPPRRHRLGDALELAVSFPAHAQAIERAIGVFRAIRADDDVCLVEGDDDVLPVGEERLACLRILLPQRGTQVCLGEIVTELLGDGGSVRRQVSCMICRAAQWFASERPLRISGGMSSPSARRLTASVRRSFSR